MPVLMDFAGDWVLSRQIIDAAYGQNGRLAGHARFTPDDGGLLYHETGQLTLVSGAVLQAERSYLWRADTTGIAVQFAGGAAFHRFDPVGQAQGSEHPCGADIYNVTYDFEAWPDWSARWVARGPRKDYTSISHYNRT